MSDFPRTILHIDDDPLLRELMTAVFDAHEHIKYQSAENGQRAVELLQNGAHPDLILLDLSMPEVDGGQFLQSMRSLKGAQGTPIIIITQFSNISLQGQHRELGVIGLLHKPVDPGSVVESILDIWRARQD